MAKVVADDGVVHGLRRSAAVRVRRDYDPARDTGGPRGDVAREVVARKLHATRRAKKRDADPREIPVELRGSTRASIVLDRVTSHLEATYVFIKLVSFEEHASAVVADRVSGDGASFSYVADVHAPRAARDVVANDLGVVVGPFRPEDDDARITGAAYVVGEDLGAGRFEDEHAKPVAYEIIPREGGIRAHVNVDPGDKASENILHDLGARTELDNDAFFVGFRAAATYNMVLRDGGVDAPGSADPQSDIAYDTISDNSSVTSVGNVDPYQVLVPLP